MSKTIGEIAKSHGFDNIIDFFDHIENLRKEVVTFNVGDKVMLPEGYKPSHFKAENCLPINTELIVSVVGEVTVGGDYQIKFEEFDDWFYGDLFVKM